MTTIINGSSPSITFSDNTTQTTAFTGSASTLTSGTLPFSVMPTGSVLQVVQGNTTTEVSSSSTSYVSTTLSASITPKSSSSKVLIMFSIGGILTFSSAYGLGYAVYRGGTPVWTDVHPYDSNYDNGNTSGIRVSRGNVQYLDTPATTSSTTYTIYFGVYTGTIAVQNSGAQSFITLIEVA
jgi:hypothetical protein